jgi:MarR family transcriptional regulator, 2-MHQ and catechol-resistance regulon repressor
VPDRRESFYQDSFGAISELYPEFEESSASVMINLIYTYDVVSTWAQKFLCGYGLAKSSFNILMILRHGPPEGMLLHDLGELLLVSRANVTGLIDHLEEKGMVRRVVDASDRRARFARITKKGETLLDEVAPLHFQRAADRLRNFSQEEREALVHLLKKLRTQMLDADEMKMAAGKLETAGPAR